MSIRLIFGIDAVINGISSGIGLATDLNYERSPSPPYQNDDLPLLPSKTEERQIVM